MITFPVYLGLAELGCFFLSLMKTYACSMEAFKNGKEPYEHVCRLTIRPRIKAFFLFYIPITFRTSLFDVDKFDGEPPPFCYSFAKNYQAIKYVRLDPTGIEKDVLLHSIKGGISKGFPFLFGFTVYNSIQQSSTTGKIPYPCRGEKVEGGHAIMAVGYDDKMSIKYELCDKATRGALLIRNSCGTEWDEKGYG